MTQSTSHTQATKRYDLLSYAEARRDAAMLQVATNSEEWFPLAVTQFEQLAASSTFRANHAEMTGEQIRYWLTPFVGKPHSPNAWGALTATLARRKLIVKTGRYTRMTDPKSNARETAVYTWRLN